MDYSINIPKRFYDLVKISDSSTSVIYSVKDKEDNDIRKVIKLTKDTNKFSYSKEILIMKLILKFSSDYFIRYSGSIVNSSNKKDSVKKEIENINHTNRNSIKNEINSVKKEIENIKNTNHNNIHSTNNITIYGIIMNTVPLSTTLLDNILLFKSQPFIFESIIVQLLNALHILHINNLVHRDIKLENVLFSSATGKITLIDFGSASYILYNQNDNNLPPEFQECINTSTTVTGTICNFSPEIIYATKENNSILYLSDIWALGAMLYTILTVEYIIDDNKYHNLTLITEFFNSIEYVNFQSFISKLQYYPYNPNICNTIKLCLTHDYHNRPNTEMLLKSLE